MVLRPTTVFTERFTYVREERLLVAEASDLPEMSRVYDDACDVGYTVVSSHTNKSVVYAVSHTERDRGGDLLYWDLEAVKPRDTTLPTVRIFND
jgi:hypothetical protein